MNLKDPTTDDTLNRKEISKQYVKLIKVLDENYVIALNAPWGSGKTTLLEYMEKDFENEDIAFINYNAWENDYTGEPFLSLISEFNIQIKEKKYLPNIAKFNSFKEVSKKVVPSIAKGITQFIIGSEAVKIIESVMSNVTSNIVNDVFVNIESSKQSRKDFREELKKITSAIIENKKHEKFVFIIDELDRCKPTFAIELLENIKHLFDIENIIFLISVDKVQLSESIKSVYGSGFDSMTYLKRFFNFDLHLRFNENTSFIESKFKVFFKNMEIDDIGGKDLVLEAFSMLNLTLRDYEQILAEIFLLYTMSKAYDWKLYFILLCLKHKHFESYDLLSNYYNTQTKDITNKFISKYGDSHFNFFAKLYSIGNKGNGYLSEDIYNAINIIESTLN